MSTTTQDSRPGAAAEEARWVELEQKLAAARADARRAREAQRESDLRHRFALKSAGLGSWQLSSDELVFHTDARHDEIFGLPETRAQWPYAELLARVLPDDRDHVDRLLRRTLKNASDVSLSCRVVRVDDAVRWVEIHGSHLPLAHGGEGERRLIGVIADITARKAAELELVESRAELERRMTRLRELDRRKDQFLAVLGHELRNPLAALHNGDRKSVV